MLQKARSPFLHQRCAGVQVVPLMSCSLGFDWLGIDRPNLLAKRFSKNYPSNPIQWRRLRTHTHKQIIHLFLFAPVYCLIVVERLLDLISIFLLGGWRGFVQRGKEVFLMRWPCICTTAIQAGLYAFAPLLAQRVQPAVFAWVAGNRGLSLSLYFSQRLGDKKTSTKQLYLL